jgi:2-octaprenylphenol hydroxylase
MATKFDRTAFDITIVGGGMVGLAMAASLAETELKILLIEKQDLIKNLPSELLTNEHINDADFDVRVSAISPGNRQFLTELNVWKNIPQQRQAHYQHMKVWDGDGTGNITFSAEQIAQPDLGVILENKVIQRALLKTIQGFGNVHCIFGDSQSGDGQTGDAQIENGLESIELTDDYAEISLTDGSHYKTKLLIGADGAYSKVREKLAIESNKSSYSQTAFVVNVKTELHHQDTAWQRFTPFGPLAFLPLANKNCCSVVWSLDEDKAELLKDVSTEKFVEKLQQAFESKLGKLTAVSKHYGFPLVKRHAKSYLLNRVALIGDAAHTIHPLAGQGVNLGFQDVACLSALIKKLITEQRDFGLIENLRPFERERKTENLVMQNAMSGFKHLFANQSMPITLLRNLAMSALDKIPMAKEVIIKKAMGL